MNREYFLNRAEELKPILRHEIVRPVTGMPAAPLHENDSFVLDFGNHEVGHLSLRFSYTGSHPDAPVWLQLKFCENPRELTETTEEYHGWISKGWIQEERLHMDTLPCALTLPRRYAFRYVRIDVLAVSSKFSLVLEDAFADCTTSADDAALLPYGGNPRNAAIDRIACRTLRSCMQDFFEDGPKRDRRLWIGDLRLQALANYATYKNNNLVKRCLYLFAAVADETGRIPACLFTEPKVEGDDTRLFDYSLLYIPTLLDYLENTGDRETAGNLLNTALNQLNAAEAYFDPETHLVRDSDALGWCFVDWNMALNKQTCAQAIWIYCAKSAERLLTCLSQPVPEGLKKQIARRSQTLLDACYDRDLGVYVSGAQRQISMAAQVWCALADVLPPKQALSAIDRAAAMEETVHMVTPYMMHHYIDALLLLGQKERCLKVIRSYWGEMAQQGADTFWELFDPRDPDASPYGSPIVNSYCHAWSCTPAWFLRSQLG